MSRNKIFTLFFGAKALGTVTNISFDQPWINADFTPFDDANSFQGFFDACTDDDGPLPEPGGEFPDEYFDDERWTVVAQDGERRNICLPAVDWNEGTISWRWRQ